MQTPQQIDPELDDFNSIILFREQIETSMSQKQAVANIRE